MFKKILTLHTLPTNWTNESGILLFVCCNEISLLIKSNFLRFALRMESHSESLKIYESFQRNLIYILKDSAGWISSFQTIKNLILLCCQLRRQSTISATLMYYKKYKSEILQFLCIHIIIQWILQVILLSVSASSLKRESCKTNTVVEGRYGSDEELFKNYTHIIIWDTFYFFSSNCNLVPILKCTKCNRCVTCCLIPNSFPECKV